jgi:hypothetical protein
MIAVDAWPSPASPATAPVDNDVRVDLVSASPTAPQAGSSVALDSASGLQPAAFSSTTSAPVTDARPWTHLQDGIHKQGISVMTALLLLFLNLEMSMKPCLMIIGKLQWIMNLVPS